MILQPLLHTLLPGFLVYSLWHGSFDNRRDWLLNALALGAGLLFLLLTSRWDYSSYYLAALWPILFAAAAMRGFGRCALDILRLDSTENRAAFPARNLADYSIYRATVLSPCAGNVIRAVDGLPDLAPPARDPQNPAGNHVVLECHHVRVLLAHLKEESLLVARGEYVETGQHLGQVGNSGNTSEPHLHIHAESGLGEILTGEGIPITLDGRFLVRNSLIPR